MAMLPRCISPKQPPGGYLTYSWNQYLRAAEEIAAGLRSLGIGKGDMVALNSETRLEFYLAELAFWRTARSPPPCIQAIRPPT